jgi:ElaB/YqjD/DUF883 family membrane-anchored ribosome-binding protein
MQRVNTDRLIEAISKARARVEASLKAAKQNLECAQSCSIEEANTAPRSKEAYFRVNAWKAIGVAGGVGLLLGAIAGLKGRSAPLRRDRPH